MELQKSMAQMGEKLQGLSEASKDHSKDLKDIGKDVHAAKVGLKIVIAVLAVAGTVIGFLVSRATDLIQAYINTAKATH